VFECSAKIVRHIVGRLYSGCLKGAKDLKRKGNFTHYQCRQNFVTIATSRVIFEAKLAGTEILAGCLGPSELHYRGTFWEWLFA